MTPDADLPVVSPPFEAADAPDGGPHRTADPPPDPTVVGVVLAAGTGSRFGDANKLLAEVGGEPLVCHAVRTLCDASLDDVAVVVGHEADRIRAAVAPLGVTVVRNDAYDRGQATSVGRGVAIARGADADAVLFALGDMPTVAVETVELLLSAYRAGVGDALAAAHDGRRGNPVLFDSRHFDALADVGGDVGGREILLAGDASALVETGDPGVLADVDRPADLDGLDGR